MKYEITPSRIIRIESDNNNISPTFCLAKWKQVSINLSAGLTHSCYHPPEHRIPLDELKTDVTALHNTSFKKQERQQMLSGTRPSGCAYCWNIEDSPNGHQSDRTYRSIELSSIEPTAYQEVLSNPADYSVIPSTVEVNFSGVCNFKCSYCSPHLSTEWKKEIEKFGPYPTSTPHNSLDYFNQVGLMPIPNREYNPYLEAFWSWWPNLYNKLLSFRMTGGEPLMDVNTYKVLDYIIEHPKKDLELAVTTNLCVDEKLINKFYASLDRVNETDSLGAVTVYVSCDAFGDRAEYIRNGLKFDYFSKNVRTFLDKFSKAKIEHTMTFIVTLNCMSITSLRDLFSMILTLRKEYNIDHVHLDSPILLTPVWQSIQILPARYREILRSDIEFLSTEFKDQITDFEIEKLKRALSWMEQGNKLSKEKLKQDRADFYSFFKEHDRRRDTDFIKVFPEMKEFWKDCRDAFWYDK